MTVTDSARRTAVLDELVALFLAEGFRGLTLDDLARRLHCSKSTLYAIAGSKEQLVVRVVRQFFATATEQVEARLAAATAGPDAVDTYLRAVSDALAPATEAFFADLSAYPPADEIYAHNTGAAAARVEALVAEGVAAGTMRAVDPAFVGAVVRQVMTGIHAGAIGRATRLDHTAAYDHLADLLTAALTPGR